MICFKIAWFIIYSDTVFGLGLLQAWGSSSHRDFLQGSDPRSPHSKVFLVTQLLANSIVKLICTIFLGVFLQCLLLKRHFNIPLTECDLAAIHHWWKITLRMKQPNGMFYSYSWSQWIFMIWKTEIVIILMQIKLLYSLYITTQSNKVAK